MGILAFVLELVLDLVAGSVAVSIARFLIACFAERSLVSKPSAAHGIGAREVLRG